MPTKSKSGDWNQENGAHMMSVSTVFQPWWRGTRKNAMPSPVEQVNGAAIMGPVPSQVNGNGSSKETHFAAAHKSGLNGHNVQELQHLKHAACLAPPAMGEHLEPNSQMELVGHSIVLTPYPYSEPHYGGLMAYGKQVHQHLLGLQHTRMPLPLDMEEEPVYVNAKQYHGILRRRQTRAKLELEKKVIKARKPYLHESRHQHAMRRARGCSGRFLNTKKLGNNGTNSPPEKSPKSGMTASTQSGNSSGSDRWPLNSTGNLDQHKGLTFQDMRNGHGDMNGHSFLSMHYP